MKKLLFTSRTLILSLFRHVITYTDCNLIAINEQEDTTFVNNPNKNHSYLKFMRKFVYFAVVFFIFGFIIHLLNKVLNIATITIMYILVMILVTRSRGMISALISALMSALSLDFFFIPPIYSFAIYNKFSLIDMLVMILTGLIIYLTNGNLRYQISQLMKTRNQSELFYEINNELTATITEEQVTDILPYYFQKIFNAKYMLFLPNSDKNLILKSGNQIAGFDENVAMWVFVNNQNAGLNTNTCVRSKLMYLPISLSIYPKGIIAIKPEDAADFLMPDTQHLLNNFIGQLATTLERIYFTQIALQTEALIKNQRPHTLYKIDNL